MQRQDCLFRRCEFYPKWWVEWGFFSPHEASVWSRISSFLRCRPLLTLSLLHLCAPDHLRILWPVVCGTEVRKKTTVKRNTFLLESRKRFLSCGCLQVWTGSRPVYRLGRFDSLHPRRLHALLLDCRHFYKKVLMTKIELCVCLNLQLTVPCVFCLFKATVRPSISTEVLPHTLISPPTREVRPRRWTRNPNQTTVTLPRLNILIRMHTCERCLPPQRRYM